MRPTSRLFALRGSSRLFEALRGLQLLQQLQRFPVAVGAIFLDLHSWTTTRLCRSKRRKRRVGSSLFDSSDKTCTSPVASVTQSVSLAKTNENLGCSPVPASNSSDQDGDSTGSFRNRPWLRNGRLERTSLLWGPTVCRSSMI